jgi:hypothetical protein
MNLIRKNSNNDALLESVRQKVEELERRLDYKPQGLDPQEQDRLDTLIHNAKRMRGFIEPNDF